MGAHSSQQPPPNLHSRPCSRASPGRWALGWDLGSTRLAKPPAAGGRGSSLTLHWGQPWLSSLMPPPALVSITQSIPCPSAEPEVVDVVPWHRLDAQWGPMLLALCCLGTTGLQCCVGTGCWRVPLLWWEMLEQGDEQGRGDVGADGDMEGDPAKVQVAMRSDVGLWVTGLSSIGGIMGLVPAPPAPCQNLPDPCQGSCCQRGCAKP